jgi:type IV secretion system protein VirB8
VSEGPLDTGKDGGSAAPSDKALLASYFREAASWDLDRAAQTIRRARLAWMVAIGGWTCALSASVAMAFLAPLKSVEPYVIRVDNSTGIVDIVPMYAGHAEIGETVARYLLTHYITVCDGFSYSTAERDYEECGAFHTAQRNQEWYAQWNPVNLQSPLNLYKDGTVIRTQVTAVTFFHKHGVRGASTASDAPELAQVRYLKSRRPPGGAEHLTHWIATIEYAWLAPPHDPRARQWNPLGWRVSEFHTEPENLSETRSPGMN